MNSQIKFWEAMYIMKEIKAIESEKLIMNNKKIFIHKQINTYSRANLGSVINTQLISSNKYRKVS
jgi:hypothetical protein